MFDGKSPGEATEVLTVGQADRLRVSQGRETRSVQILMTVFAVYKGKSGIFSSKRARPVFMCEHHWQNWCQRAAAQPQDMRA